MAIPKNPLDKIGQQFIGDTMLKYPNDLDGPGNSKATLFRILKYNKEQIDSNEKSEPIQTIALPLPPSISQQDTLNWDTAESSELEAAGNLFNNPSMQNFEEFAKGLGSGMLRTINSNEAGATETFRGEAQNPRQIATFQRVDFRTFSYTLKMIARNAKESEDIRKIVHTLRAYAHPSLSSGYQFMYNYPAMFDISFVPRSLNDSMFEPKTAALTSVQVDYSDEASVLLFNDTDEPVEVNLSLEFQELEIENQQNIINEYLFKSQ